MAKKRNIESASVFERSGIRAIRARAIEVLLYFTSLDCFSFLSLNYWLAAAITLSDSDLLADHFIDID